MARDRGNRDKGRPRRSARVPMAEYTEPDGPHCAAEYAGPNLEAWADAGYAIGTCTYPPGHRGHHRAAVAWGAGDTRGDQLVPGTVTWEVG